MMKLISAIEYYQDSYLLRTLEKFEVEHQIIKENTYRFQLAYNSPIFSTNILSKLGAYGQNDTVQLVIINDTLIESRDEQII